MSPSYPNMANLGLYVDGNVFACYSGTATWKVSINAEIPENCPFIFYADDQPPVKVWNASLFHLILNFTAVKLVFVFNGTACANDTYRGYVVQFDAEYIEPDTIKTLLPDYLLIIGLSGGGFIVACMIIVSIAIYCIRSKQKRYNKIYKLLEEMNLTQEEINEMKLKSDELLIKPGKIHINFDTILGKGASSTVYKGHLIGLAPLYEQRKNEQTEQFVDCDVAVKVTNHFGTNETFSYQTSLNKKLPIKWLSLEALLDRLFTEKSDVWSFGVLMYEMFSFGATPYETMNNDELVMFLQSGGRLERPANMDDVCYGIMLLCWNKDFRTRPGFMELEEKFGELSNKYSV
uniref:Protein kinase domain-containing protein n=1 Tax=Acrobeloides nanus TaxID=290746 RepID=A0A914CXP0_9BILA